MAIIPPQSIRLLHRSFGFCFSGWQKFLSVHCSPRSRGQGQKVKLGLLYKMDKLHLLFKKISTLELSISLGSTRYLTSFRGKWLISFFGSFSFKTHKPYHFQWHQASEIPFLICPPTINSYSSRVLIPVLLLQKFPDLTEIHHSWTFLLAPTSPFFSYPQIQPLQLGFYGSALEPFLVNTLIFLTPLPSLHHNGRTTMGHAMDRLVFPPDSYVEVLGPQCNCIWR